ncbi:MAG: SpoIIE family protein phosphatase [Acidobacteria bacterium]|nr:SpoIIE family protein phosphatase [Acidobacteriota bacterium]
MPFKPIVTRPSIKAGTLGLLAVVLLLCALGYLGIQAYTRSGVSDVFTRSMDDLDDFEGLAGRQLKNAIVTELVFSDLKAYADLIGQRVAEARVTPAPGASPAGRRAAGDPPAAPVPEPDLHAVLSHVLDVEAYRPGFLFVVDRSGRVLVTEGLSRDPFEARFTVGRPLLGPPGDPLSETVGSILRSDRDGGARECTLSGRDWLFLYYGMPKLRCTLVKVLSKDFLAGQVREAGARIAGHVAAIRGKFASLYDRIRVVALMVFAAVLAAGFLIGSTLARAVTRPLVRLTEAARRLGRGDLDQRIDIPSGGEIGELAASFNAMAEDLKVHVRQLAESIAAREAVEEEIRLAARIQRASLPADFPAFAPGAELDLAACLEPSRVVSGDFYDHFFPDESRLFFAIGDVSGKNVSAALFMTTVKVLLKKYALMGLRPDEILRNVNDTLALDNRACMYATVFCGFLDLSTGRLEYCNGGHPHPLLRRGGAFDFVRARANMLVGLTGEARFEAESLELDAGGALFAYSDGVTEARGPGGEQFSEERLRAALLELPGESTAREIVEGVRRAVSDFTGVGERCDDLTMLCIRLPEKALPG